MICGKEGKKQVGSGGGGRGREGGGGGGEAKVVREQQDVHRRTHGEEINADDENSAHLLSSKGFRRGLANGLEERASQHYYGSKRLRRQRS